MLKTIDMLRFEEEPNYTEIYRILTEVGPSAIFATLWLYFCVDCILFAINQYYTSSANDRDLCDHIGMK